MLFDHLNNNNKKNERIIFVIYSVVFVLSIQIYYLN